MDEGTKTALLVLAVLAAAMTGLFYLFVSAVPFINKRARWPFVGFMWASVGGAFALLMFVQHFFGTPSELVEKIIGAFK